MHVFLTAMNQMHLIHVRTLDDWSFTLRNEGLIGDRYLQECFETHHT
jgi:hypothetical protein